MTSRWQSLYWKVFFRTARIFGLLLAVVSLAGAIAIAADRHSHMDNGLKWGLVALMLVMCVLGVLMLRAPVRRA
jgi:hypothetical protein